MIPRPLVHHHAFLDWVQTTELSHLASGTTWVFATAQSMHFMGLSILFGALVVLDLRILGVIPGAPVARLAGLIPLALVGFAIQVATGIVMFSAEPNGYWANAAFRLKMALIALAGLNALWFWAFEHRRLKGLAPDAAPRWSAKLVAAGSILTWVLVITLGRFIPYLHDVVLPWVPGA